MGRLWLSLTSVGNQLNFLSCLSFAFSKEINANDLLVSYDL